MLHKQAVKSPSLEVFGVSRIDSCISFKQGAGQGINEGP